MSRRLPAEWEAHDATWIGWPPYVVEHADAWNALSRAFAAVVDALQTGERVEILCPEERVRGLAQSFLAQRGVPPDGHRLHIAPFDYAWMRDIVPMTVQTDDGSVELLHWYRRIWDDTVEYANEPRIGHAVERITGLTRVEPQRPDGRVRIALDGGAVDVNGAGMILVTEEHLLSGARDHNPGFTRTDYERLFAEYLGAERTIWLGRGCVGDLTSGHIDNVARWVAADTIVLAYEADPTDANHLRSLDNLQRLERLAGRTGRPSVVRIPFPRPLASNRERLPASYANFYIGNRVVLVPTFEDRNDEKVLRIFEDLLPGRAITPIPSLHMLPGRGALHCITKEQAVPIRAPHGLDSLHR